MIIKKRYAGFAGLLALASLVGLLLLLPAADKVSVDEWQGVQPEPLVVEIGLAGQIEPMRIVTLAAPFDGNVLQRLVHDGQAVEEGQALLIMDPAQIEVQLRDALAQQLKARREVQLLDGWDTSNQVSRARRALRTAQAQQAHINRRLDESARLYERGIIARNELDDLQQQVRAHRDELIAAQDELQHVLEQGGVEHRQIAEMELTNASVKYEALLKQLESGTVRAPFRGVLVAQAAVQDARPGAAATVQEGSRVSTGQSLFGLADIEQLRVVAAVSELDVNQLQPGQAVQVTGDGFEGVSLVGTVLAVNSQGIADDGSSGSAKFAVTLSVEPLNREQLRQVRLGMSARLSVAVYRNDQAMIVPAAALAREGDATWVEYRLHSEQPGQRVVVTTGKSTRQGVEVFGLAAGYVRVAL